MGELIKDTTDRWSSAAGRRANALAQALRAAGDSLRDQGQDRLAGWSGSAAGEVERVSSYLEHEDSRALMHDLEDMARRNPGAFIGLSFAAGLTAGRFLRASEPRAGDGRTEEVRA